MLPPLMTFMIYSKARTLITINEGGLFILKKLLILVSVISFLVVLGFAGYGAKIYIDSTRSSMANADINSIPLNKSKVDVPTKEPVVSSNTTFNNADISTTEKQKNVDIALQVQRGLDEIEARKEDAEYQAKLLAFGQFLSTGERVVYSDLLTNKIVGKQMYISGKVSYTSFPEVIIICDDNKSSTVEINFGSNAKFKDHIISKTKDLGVGDLVSVAGWAQGMKSNSDNTRVFMDGKFLKVDQVNEASR